MKDEIKEILDKLKENISIVSVEEEHLLLDYITNLQEENGKLNNIIKHIYKELREFNVPSLAASIQISYLEEYLEENIEDIDFEYLQELKGDK